MFGFSSSGFRSPRRVTIACCKMLPNELSLAGGVFAGVALVCTDFRRTRANVNSLASGTFDEPADWRADRAASPCSLAVVGLWRARAAINSPASSVAERTAGGSATFVMISGALMGGVGGGGGGGAGGAGGTGGAGCAGGEVGVTGAGIVVRGFAGGKAPLTDDDELKGRVIESGGV